MDFDATNDKNTRTRTDATTADPVIDRRTVLKGAAGAAAGAAALGGSGWTAGAAPLIRNLPMRQNTDVSGSLRYQLLSSSADEVGRVQNLIDTLFRAQYPNVEVSVEPQPENRAEALITSMIGGDAPDVFDTWRDDVVLYADVDQVLDVTERVESDLDAATIEDFFQWQWADFVLPSGIRFGMPKFVNMMTVWTNLDALESAGIGAPDDSWTHDTYADAARQLTVVTGDTTERWGLYFPAWTIDRYAYKLEAFGGSLVDPEDPTRAAFGEPPALEAASWVRDLIFEDGAMAEFALIFPSGTGGVAATTPAFAAGRMAMAEDGLYPITIAEQIAQAQTPFRWQFSPVPPGPAGRHVLGTADGFSIWSGSENQDAAWELLKFLSGPEYGVENTRVTGYLPSRRSIFDQWVQICTEAFPDLANANLEMARQAMEEGYPNNRPLFENDAAAQQLLDPALEGVFISGEQPVEYLQEVAEEVTAEQQG